MAYIALACRDWVQVQMALLGVQSCLLLAKHLGRVVPLNTPVLFEAKCKSAFVAVPGGDKFRFLGPKAKPLSVVPPYWYAQVQLGMLSANVSVALLAVYRTGYTMLVCIPRNDLWCNMMLKSVQWFMQRYVLTGTVPPVDFCHGLGESQREQQNAAGSMVVGQRITIRLLPTLFTRTCIEH